MTVALSELLSRLRESPTAHPFTAAQLRPKEGVYLAIDDAGHPCLFLQAGAKLAEASVRTSGLLLQPNQEYLLTFEDGTAQSGRYHLMACLSSQGSDEEGFLVLIEAFFLRRDSVPQDQALVSLFHSMVRLFAVSQVRDLRSERQGLWGELFTMSRVRGFAFWAPYWHSEPTRLFDFFGASGRVEVKTALGTERVHHFSHRQIYATEGEEILVASLLLREEGSGVTLKELIMQCRIELRDTPHYLKIERAARRAGMAGTTETGPSYDPASAERDLAWYRAAGIPHFRLPEPVGVSETHYRADLTNAPRLSPDELEAWLSGWTL